MGLQLDVDVLHPGDNFTAFVGLLHGEMDHRMAGCGAVPVLLSGREPYGIAGGKLFDLAAIALRVTDAAEDEEHLSARMDVPDGARAGGEGDHRAALAG